jgi:hypothetical protein
MADPLTRQDLVLVLRALRRGLTEAIAVLGPPLSEREEGRARMLRVLWSMGPSRLPDVIVLFRKCGLDPRTLGSLTRFGWLQHDGDIYSATEKGRSWAFEQDDVDTSDLEAP